MNDDVALFAGLPEQFRDSLTKIPRTSENISEYLKGPIRVPILDEKEEQEIIDPEAITIESEIVNEVSLDSDYEKVETLLIKTDYTKKQLMTAIANVCTKAGIKFTIPEPEADIKDIIQEEMILEDLYMEVIAHAFSTEIRDRGTFSDIFEKLKISSPSTFDYLWNNLEADKFVRILEKAKYSPRKLDYYQFPES